MRRFVLATLMVSFVLANIASAQTREFTGTIDRIGPDSLAVQNRMGDSLSFGRQGSTVVAGEQGGKKKSWRDLEKGDRVTVHWNLKDTPRRAYRVIVLPERKKSGEGR